MVPFRMGTFNEVYHDLDLERSRDEQEERMEHFSAARRKKETNYLQVPLDEARARSLRSKESADGDGLFGKRERDLQLARADFTREEAVERAHIAREEAMRKTLERRQTLDKKPRSGWTADDRTWHQAMAKYSVEDMTTWVEDTYEKRQKATKAKELHWTRQKEIQKELDEIRKTSASNSIRKMPNGLWVKTYHQAPGGIEQSLKRDKKAIGKDWANMLCSPNKLKKLDYRGILKLLREYKEAFDETEEFWGILNTAETRLDRARDSISRHGAAQLLRATLISKLHIEYDDAVNVLMAGTNTKREFLRPLLKEPRERAEKLDGKTEERLLQKAEIRDLEERQKARRLKGKNWGGTKKRGQKSQGGGKRKPYRENRDTRRGKDSKRRKRDSSPYTPKVTKAIKEEPKPNTGKGAGKGVARKKITQRKKKN